MISVPTPLASPEINNASHSLGILTWLVLDVLDVLDARYLTEEFYGIADIYSQEAERGECLCSAPCLLSLQSGPPAHGMLPPASFSLI